MEERHLHFNIIQALWFTIFFIVMINLAKFLLNKWQVPGVTELVNAV